MSRLNIILLIVFAALLIWITLFSPDQIARIQSGTMTFFRPFIKASDRADRGFESVNETPMTPSEMRSKIEELERDRGRLQLEVLQLDEILFENNQLREALQYRQRSPLRLRPARVMSRKPVNWYNTLVIDKGSADGVSVDSPVIVPVDEDGAGLIGKVSEVLGSHEAVVLLLTDEMCQVSARLENSQEQGILSGQRGSLRSLPPLKLRYLSKEAETRVGQRVVTSGTGGVFPPDLILGEVTSARVGVIDAEATVKPLVNFRELLDVFVVMRQEEAVPPPASDDQASEIPPGSASSAPDAAEPEAAP
ncbi:MAG: rod shape-determining protein MreC [Verrucomicrobiota bacterium]